MRKSFVLVAICAALAGPAVVVGLLCALPGAEAATAAPGDR